jgi:hypothetical protein
MLFERAGEHRSPPADVSPSERTSLVPQSCRVGS